MEFYNKDLGKLSINQEILVLGSIEDWNEQENNGAYIVDISLFDGIVGFLLSNGCNVNFNSKFTLKRL